MTAVETLTRERVTPETVSPLKPSEALRLGRLVRPRRIEGTMYSGEDGACAAGAITIGGFDESHGWQHIWRLDCPFACKRSGMTDGPTGFGDSGLGLIPHLNDDHHWSDDQIVAYLESLGL
jgi:hypothetical protein